MGESVCGRNRNTVNESVSKQKADDFGSARKKKLKSKNESGNGTDTKSSDMIVELFECEVRKRVDNYSILRYKCSYFRDPIKIVQISHLLFTESGRLCITLVRDKSIPVEYNTIVLKFSREHKF